MQSRFATLKLYENTSCRTIIPLAAGRIARGLSAAAGPLDRGLVTSRGGSSACPGLAHRRPFKKQSGPNTTALRTGAEPRQLWSGGWPSRGGLRKQSPVIVQSLGLAHRDARRIRMLRIEEKIAGRYDDRRNAQERRGGSIKPRSAQGSTYGDGTPPPGCISVEIVRSKSFNLEPIGNLDRKKLVGRRQIVRIDFEMHEYLEQCQCGVFCQINDRSALLVPAPVGPPSTLTRQVGVIGYSPKQHPLP
jgi:hypothetical protein